MKGKCIHILVLLFLTVQSSAQTSERAVGEQSRQGFLFSPQWSYQVVGGDMKERFYNFSSIGISAEYKFKSNIQLGVTYDWFYGERVKEAGIFEGITGPSSQIIDQNGNFSVVSLDIRGHNAAVTLGYVLPFNKKTPNSGLLMSLGGGYMQHKIDMIASQTTIPQINGDYEAGYDRLTGGFVLKEYIGYQYLVGHNRIHLRAGVEFNQGFLKGMRSWNYSTNTPGDLARFDHLTAFKLGIIVPVYTKAAEDEEFFLD